MITGECIEGTVPCGTVLGERYLVKRLVGRGGMGEVYEAEHRLTGQRVALKAIWPHLMAEQTSRERFLQEGRTLVGLQHRGIVGLQDLFEEQGRFFLALQFVDGTPLDAQLEEHWKTGDHVPIDNIIHVLRGILDPLSYAHRHGPQVVHRDIKPSNVVVGGDGRVVVMDFGIAKVMGGRNLTRTRGPVGTPEYMSPEQIDGRPVTPASDVYAVGILAYQMLSGQVPFPQRTETGMEVMTGHLECEPPPLCDARPDCPDWLAATVERALAKRPEDRYFDAGEMLREFEGQVGRPWAGLPVAAQSARPREEPSARREKTPVRVAPRPAVPRSAVMFLGVGLALAVAALVVVGALRSGWFGAGGERGPAEQKQRPAATRDEVARGNEPQAGAEQEAMKQAPRPAQEDVKSAKGEVVTPPRALPPVPSPSSRPAEARATVLAFLEAVRDGELAGLYAFLPPSYLKDLDGLVQGFAKAMDKELFNRYVGVAGRVVAFAKKHETEIARKLAFRLGNLGVSVTEANVISAIDGAAEVWSTLKEAGVLTLEKLETVQLAQLVSLVLPGLTERLKGVVDNNALQQVSAEISRMDVQEVGRRTDPKWGSVTELSLTDSSGTSKEEFVKVDGGWWVPLSMAEGWASAMSDAQAGLGSMKETMASQKSALLADVETAERAMTEMESTGNTDTIVNAVVAAISQAGG